MDNATTGGLTFYAAAGTFDAHEKGMQHGSGLLVSNGQIVAVGSPGNVCPPDAQVVDLGSTFIVPGFFDAHTHITIRPGEGDQHGQMAQPPAWQAIRGVANLQAMLKSGVTTARIMTEEADIDFHFKAAVANGEVAGPTLRVAGRGLSPPGKHGGAVAGVQGRADLSAAVAANAAKGADHIKIFTTGGVSSTDTSLDESNYSAEEIAAIVDTAAEHSLTVSAHAHGGPGVDLAVANGIHSIEHGALLTADSVRRIVEAGVWIVLTNTILFHPNGIEQGDAQDPRILAKVQQARASMERAIELIRAEGARVALGTDSMHGLFGYELQWLTEHGYTVEEALLAATRSAAELAGVDNIGRLAPGSQADFSVLDRDPFEHISAVYDIRAVYRAGRQVVAPDGYTRPAPLSATLPEGEPNE
ncbi:amidohydrolase family protein [Ornithinimicrobium sediminis]|uniref:amidohydrolase family protein n=1 Tax=Ornithinimicrobium sediminis TaxID=2904603 RepID=UPI001E290598|nr:amidohydrolase family protein [Ornithinimicrobium sediminis]MCE0485467.1 amidohydrolase family protein [Ornithinimicrobium sediminis]